MLRKNILLAFGLLLPGCGELREDLVSLFHGSGHGSHGGGEGEQPSPDGGTQPTGPDCVPPIDIDQLYAAVSADLAALDSADRAFARYVSLANRIDAGLCASELDAERAALGKLLNGTSQQPQLTLPVAIDAARLTYRFDLRDYGWDEAVQVGEQSFVDGWEAVLAASPFAIEYSGPDADSAKAFAGTNIPVMALDAFVDAASNEDVYYALIRIPEDVESLFAGLGIDVDADIGSGVALRAGTTQSRVSRNNRILERYPVSGRGAGLWRAQNLVEESQDEMFTDPFSAPGADNFVLLPLSNGLFAFAIFDADGNRAGSSDVILDFNQNDFRARASTSCSSCHSQGVISFEDEVRPFVEANAGDFDPDVVDAVRAIYPTAAEAFDTVQADSSVFRSALFRIGVDVNGLDPISRTALQFDLDVEPHVMAGDLLVSETVFQASLFALPGALSERSLDRDDFALFYAASVCVLHADAANHPVDCP